MRRALLLFVLLFLSKHTVISQEVNLKELYYCNGKEVGNVYVFNKNHTVCLSKNLREAYLLNEGRIITDTLKMIEIADGDLQFKTEFALKFIILDTVSFSISGFNISAYCKIESDKFVIKKRINWEVSKTEIGKSKVLINDFVILTDIIPGKKIKNKITNHYYYSSLNQDKLTKPVQFTGDLDIKSEFKEGGGNFYSDYFIVNGVVYIPYEKPNIIITIDTTTKMVKYIALPEIKEKNNECWNYYFDISTSKSYLVNYKKFGQHLLFDFDIGTNNLTFIRYIPFTILRLVDDQMMYSKETKFEDGKTDLCYFLVPIYKK